MVGGRVFHLGPPNEFIDLDSTHVTFGFRISDDELAKRKAAEEAKGDAAYKPGPREREVSRALKAYAHFAASADKGAVRVIED